MNTSEREKRMSNDLDALIAGHDAEIAALDAKYNAARKEQAALDEADIARIRLTDPAGADKRAASVAKAEAESEALALSIKDIYDATSAARRERDNGRHLREDVSMPEFLKAKPASSGPYSGGSGTSKEDAVIVTVPMPFMGVSAEYAYVQTQCGQRDVDWKVVSQAALLGENSKAYDRLTVKQKDGTTREFYFDISSFYGQ